MKSLDTVKYNPLILLFGLYWFDILINHPWHSSWGCQNKNHLNILYLKRSDSLILNVFIIYIKNTEMFNINWVMKSLRFQSNRWIDIIIYTFFSTKKCTRCPSGSACPDLDKATIDACDSGTYSLSGEAGCTDCPAGYSCPSIFEPLILVCPPGSFSIGRQAVSYIFFDSFIFYQFSISLLSYIVIKSGSWFLLG